MTPSLHLKIKNQESSNFFPPNFIRCLLLQACIQVTFQYSLFCIHSTTQFMKGKKSFFEIKQQTMSQHNLPVIYASQVHIRNLNNIFRIRGSYSDPLNFLNKKQSCLPKTTSVSSEEQNLRQEIEDFKAKEKKFEALGDAQRKKLEEYRQLSLEEMKRGNEKNAIYYQRKQQKCVELILEYGKIVDKTIANRRESEKKLQKLRAQKI